MAEYSELLILGWLVLQLTGSPWQIALVGLSRTTSTFAFSLIAGVIGDQKDRRSVVMGAQMGSTFVMVGVLIVVTTGIVEPWHLFLSAALRGACRSFEHTCRRALIFDVVGSRNLLQAVSLDHIGFSSGKILGPLLIGILLEVTGTAVSAYAFLTVLHLSSLGTIALVRPPALGPMPPRRPVFRSITEGLKFAFSTPPIAAVLYASVVMNALFQFQLFIPVVAQEYLHVGPGLMGLLASADGIGTIIGAVLLSLLSNNIRRHGRIFIVGSMGVAIFLLWFAISPWYWLSFLLLMCSGVSQVGFSTMQSSILLMASPTHVHSRVFGAQQLAVGTGQIGSLEIGALAVTIGLPAALASTAIGGLVLLAAILFLMPVLRGPITQYQEPITKTRPDGGKIPSKEND